ncbi:DinB family protein [Collimonas humicola]|uniref:DinB family protein n=1 Tax=Collimonas humicola TaxID=2825886 RepID=UPI001B8BE70E|nr:DinB family protein [Collimonas humicola]
MNAKNLFTTLFEYKAWANDTLFAAVSALPQDAHEREKHDATRILNHVYVVDRIFEANLQRLPHDYKGLNTPATPALADLRAAVRETDGRLLAYAGGLSEAELDETVDFIFVDGSPGRMSRAEMLMHVLTHGNYHRGAVGRILAQIGVPPQRDTLTVFMHRPERASAGQLQTS